MDAIRKLVEPEGDASFHYLEYEDMTITQEDVTWKVYGSPVRASCRRRIYNSNDFPQGSPWFGGL